MAGEARPELRLGTRTYNVSADGRFVMVGEALAHVSLRDATDRRGGLCVLPTEDDEQPSERSHPDLSNKLLTRLKSLAGRLSDRSRRLLEKPVFAEDRCCG
jgi:hypothetical protein